MSKRSRGAKRAQKLLQRPDRTMGLILIGNNAVNIMAAITADIIFSRIFGPSAGFWATTVLLTLIMLVFAEVTPKTLAAAHPESIAFRSSHVLRPLMKLMLPFVIFINWITNALVRLFGIDPTKLNSNTLNSEELRQLVTDDESQLSDQHQDLLSNVLDLENLTIQDIMTPRGEIYGIDLQEPIESIEANILSSDYTRVPLYEGNINQIIGVLHLRKINIALASDEVSLSVEALYRFADEPYFVPDSTTLQHQLIQFQKHKQRFGFVINEYGDLQGLVTLDDLLEEIVGSYTTNENNEDDIIQIEGDGFIIDATANIREINKSNQWDIPTDGPKTINGLIIEHVEFIPEENLCVRIGNYLVETRSISKTGIETAFIRRVTKSNSTTSYNEDD